MTTTNRSHKGRDAGHADQAQQLAARVEDLAWMVRHGESDVGAAARLGISLDGLEKSMQRAGRSDLIAAARRNRREGSRSSRNPDPWT